jgi:HEAT repeat protein
MAKKTKSLPAIGVLAVVCLCTISVLFSYLLSQYITRKAINQAIAEYLSTDQGEDNQAYIDELKKYGDSATEALLEASRNEKNRVKQSRLSQMIVDIMSDGTMELLHAHRTDSSARVRETVAWSFTIYLMNNRDRKASQALVSMASDPDPRVRSTVASGLDSVRDNSGRFSLIYMLEDEDSSVRFSAMQSLAGIGNSEDVKRFERIYSASEDSKEKGNALVALCTMKNSGQLLPTIKKEANEETTKRLRIWRHCYLAKFANDEDALMSIIAHLDDPDFEAMWQACSALHNLGKRKASIHALIEIGKNHSGKRWFSAVNALRCIVPVNLGYDYSAWQKWYESNSDDLQGDTEKELVKGTIDEYLHRKGMIRDTLVKYLHGDKEQSKIAEKALVAMDFSAPDMFLLAYRHDRKNPKKIASLCIKIGKPTVPVLLEILKNSTLPERMHAIRALKHIGDPRAIPPLKKELSTAFGEMARVIQEAIDKIKEKELSEDR